MDKKIRLTRARRFWRKNRIGYLFLLPFIVLFFMFFVLPVLTAIGMSFTRDNIIQPASFVGVSNYARLFTEDDVFIKAVSNTFLFSVITGPISFMGAFMVAWVISKMRFRKIFALAFYIPSIISTIAMTVVWMSLFSSDRLGIINFVLIRLGLTRDPILWNQNPMSILTVLIIIQAWMGAGAGFLSFLAGFGNIPHVLYEAGAIDGIRRKYQELIYITIPMMKPQLLFGAIMSTVTSFGVFDIALMVAGLPSPKDAGATIVTHLYDYAFIRFEMGYASAIAVILFLVTFILGRIFMRVFATND